MSQGKGPMMAMPTNGSPCWADAMFTDFEGAKAFYEDVLGWTFGESQSQYGNYTQAYADGKAVAALVPPMPGQEDLSRWVLYLASDDAAATADRIRENGGEIVVEPMQVGDFGTMVLARDPGGTMFGVWQAGQHRGFEATGTPGAYAWAEVCTRDAAGTDAFFRAVFGYRAQRMDDPDIDMMMYSAGGDVVLGRLLMTDDFPPDVPAFINVYFAVPDCDEAVARTTARGGTLHYGPMDSPFGRFAALSDPQGAVFAVVDMGRTTGAMPALHDV